MDVNKFFHIFQNLKKVQRETNAAKVSNQKISSPERKQPVSAVSSVKTIIKNTEDKMKVEVIVIKHSGSEKNKQGSSSFSCPHSLCLLSPLSLFLLSPLSLFLLSPLSLFLLSPLSLFQVIYILLSISFEVSKRYCLKHFD